MSDNYEPVGTNGITVETVHGSLLSQRTVTVSATFAVPGSHDVTVFTAEICSALSQTIEAYNERNDSADSVDKDI